MAAFRNWARFSAILFALCFFSWCAQTQSLPWLRELTQIEAVKKLSPAEAAKSYPVKIRGVVTTFSGWKNSFFLQSGSAAISVDRTDSAEVHSGDLVEVSGVSAAGLFAPVVTADRVTVLGRANLPDPRHSEYSSLATGVDDSDWVQVRGIVHSATISDAWGRKVLFLGLRVGRDNLTVRVLDYANTNYDKLVDSLVTIDGACGTIFNDKRQLTGVRLFVPSLADVHVIQQAPADPFSIAETPVTSIFKFGFSNSLDHRIKVKATVSYQDVSLGRLYLQVGDESVVVRTTQSTPVQPGARVEAVGFLENAQISITIADAIFRKVGNGAPPVARPVRAADMIKTEDNFKFAPYDGLLTRISGQLIEKVRHPDQETWVMRDGDQIFEAVFRSKTEADQVAGVGLGSRVQLTGVSRTELNQRFEPRSFIILVRSASDVVLLEARWWDAKRSLWLSGVLMFASLLMLAWVMQTRRVLFELGTRQAGATRSIPPWERHGSRYAAIIVAGTTVAALFGWALNIGILRTLLPDSPEFYPNAAIGFFLAAIALMYASTRSKHSRLLQTVAASMGLAIGLATLAEYSFGVDLRIDELLFADTTPTSGIAHGRMAAATAITIVLVSIAIILANRKRFTNASQLLAAAAGLVGILNLLGHLYGERTLFAFGSQVGMALHSLIACFLLCGGVLALRKDRGVMSLITSDASGGVMARVLLPAAIVLPAILGWLRWYGQFSLGLYDTAAGLTLFTASVIIVFVIMTLASAALLNRSDTERARMQYEATHDALTSVMNRHGILEQMRVEMSRCFREKRTMGIALVDVDRFKLVNDELGHNAGDEVLKEVAQRLKKSLRAYDGVGRYGGEEFLLVLPGCDLDSAMMRAEALRSAIASSTIALAEESRDVTISIGVSVYNPNEGVPREELIRWADVALYAAKANGRNQVQPYSVHREQERTLAPTPTPTTA